MTRLVSPGFTALQMEIEARENSLLEINSVGGGDKGLSLLKIYIDGNVRSTPPRLRAQASGIREVIPVEPGEHRLQVRDADVASFGRRESNVLQVRVQPGARICVSVRFNGPMLHIDITD